MFGGVKKSKFLGLEGIELPFMVLRRRKGGLGRRRFVNRGYEIYRLSGIGMV
jgi:hypothetical protein